MKDNGEKKKKQIMEADPQIIQTLDLSDKDFKIMGMM